MIRMKTRIAMRSNGPQKQVRPLLRMAIRVFIPLGVFF